MANDLKVFTGLQVSGSVGMNGTLNVAGVSTLAAVTATTVSASSTLQAGGAATLAGGLTVVGGALNASAVAVSASALNVSGVSTLTGDVTFGGNIVADANEAKSIFAGVTSNTITVGAAGATVSIPGTASVGGNLTVTGDLTVNGTTVTVNAENVLVEDKNIILGAGSGGGTDSLVDGGGITLSGSTDKTFNWVNATDSWTSSEHIDLASGKALKLATLTVLETGSITHPQIGTLDATILSYGGAGEGAFVSVGSSSSGPIVSISSSLQTLIRGTGMSGQAGGVALEGGEGGVEVTSYSSVVDGIKVYATDGGIKLQTDSTTHGIILAASNVSGGVIAQGPLHVSDNNSYSNFTNTQFDGQYTNITGALKAIDTALGTVMGGSSVTPAEYYSLRVATKGQTQSGGGGIVRFFLSGSPGSVAANEGNTMAVTASCPVGLSGSTGAGCLANFAYASLDVAVQINNLWTNDLVSVQVSASQNGGSGSFYPYITVEGAALSDGTAVKLIVVQESRNTIS